MRLSDAVDGYLLARRTRLAANTVRNYRTVLGRLVTRLGDPDIESITADDMRAYLARCADVDIARAQRAHSPADNWRL
jgi:site-specific recombinase XerD